MAAAGLTGVAARRTVPGLRGAAPRHRRGGPPLTRALPRRAGAHARHRASEGASGRAAGRGRTQPAGLTGLRRPDARAAELGPRRPRRVPWPAGRGGGVRSGQWGRGRRCAHARPARRRRHLARRSAGLGGLQAGSLSVQSAPEAFRCPRLCPDSRPAHPCIPPIPGNGKGPSVVWCHALAYVHLCSLRLMVTSDPSKQSAPAHLSTRDSFVSMPAQTSGMTEGQGRKPTHRDASGLSVMGRSQMHHSQAPFGCVFLAALLSPLTPISDPFTAAQVKNLAVW